MATTITPPAEDATEATHELRFMSDEGDTRISWNPSNADEVAAARRTFDELRAKRYNAYRMGPMGDQGELIREFDPQAGRIIMTMPMAGG